MARSRPGWAEPVPEDSRRARYVGYGVCRTSVPFSGLAAHLRDDCDGGRNEPDDASEDDFRETLRRAGFRENCEACRSAVARGFEACATHYIPTTRRTP